MKESDDLKRQEGAHRFCGSCRAARPQGGHIPRHSVHKRAMTLGMTLVWGRPRTDLGRSGSDLPRLSYPLANGPGVTRTGRKWHEAPLKHWEGRESWGTRSHHQQHRCRFYFKTKIVLEKVTTRAKMCQRGSLFLLISAEVWDWGKWKRPFQHDHLGLFRSEQLARDKQEDTYSAFKISPPQTRWEPAVQPHRISQLLHLCLITTLQIKDKAESTPFTKLHLAAALCVIYSTILSMELKFPQVQY